MNTHAKASLSNIRTSILYGFPLTTEECGHLYYDGDCVSKNIEEAYVWYKVAQCSGNHVVDSLVNYIDAHLIKPNRRKLLSRAKHIYARTLLHEEKEIIRGGI